MATIGKLVVSLSADSAKLTKGLAKSRKGIAKWGASVAKTVAKAGALFAGLGLILGGGLLVAINKNAAAIDDMTKAAGKLNFPIEDFQKFAFIAEKSNVSIDVFGKGMQRMLKTVGDARAGLTTAADALEQLGLNADDLAQLNPSQQFQLIAEKMALIPTQADKVKVAMDIFGRSGADLLNVFAGDVKGIGDEFDSLGLALTQQQSDMVAAYQDSKTTLSAIFDGFSRQVTAQVSPALTLIVDAVNDAIKNMGGMKQAANRFALAVIEGVAGGIEAIGSLIVGLAELQLFQQKSILLFKTMDNVAGKIVPFGEDFSTESLEKTAAEINRLQTVINKGGNIPQSLIDLMDKLKLTILDVGNEAVKSVADKMEIIPNIKVFNDDGSLNIMASAKATIEANKKLQDEANKTAESLGALSQAVNATASTQAAANISDQFNQYIDLAKRDLNSGSIFASDKINTLNNLIEASKNNAALPETTKAMQDMVDSLNNVVVQPSASQNNPALTESKSLGSLTLNMITNVGEVTGKVLGTPQFLQSVRDLVERQVNDVARATAN